METIFKVSVDEKKRGQRLDKFLADHFEKDFSRVFLQKLLKKGKVLLNGQIPKRHHRVNAGETVEITVSTVSPAFTL